MSEALVTVGIPSIGRPLLMNTIDSLRNQLYQNWIAIVSDNSNSSKVREMVESFNDKRILYTSHSRNIGGIQNCNSLMEKAKTEYCVILHDDDYLHINYLKMMIEKMESNQSAGWGFCNAFLVNEDLNASILLNPNHVGQTELFRHGTELVFKILESRLKIAMPSVIFRKEAYKRHKFDSTYGPLVDLQMWIRLALASDVMYLNEPLFYYRCWEGNASRTLAYDGVFFTDTKKLFAWLEELEEFSAKKHRLNELRTKASISQYKIILWSAMLSRSRDHRKLIEMLNEEKGMYAFGVKFLLKRPRLLLISAKIYFRIRHFHASQVRKR